MADAFGRRWAMIIPAIIALAVTPTYLLTNDYLTLAIGFSVQGLFGGAIYGQNPSYLSERSRPRSARRLPASAITRARSSAVWSPRC